MKKTSLMLSAVAVITLICATILFAGASGAVSDDPADNYTVRTAEYEDNGIKLWFDHSFRKNFTSDRKSTGMNTYSVYMAKNEIESAQFVLCSAVDKPGLSAEIEDFTDDSGNKITAEIYYEMYVTADGVNDENIMGGYDENPIIRSGEIPDPVVPLDKVKTFKLNAGKSQAFLIRLKTEENTAPGWYKANLNIYDSEKKQIKTAEVYAYVWDFVIPEETTFRSAFFVNNDKSYGGSYEVFYNYLLENRLVAMDIPGTLTPDNPYLTNPRVNSVRVTRDGGGASGYYMDTEHSYGGYRDIYCNMRSSDIWDTVKDKLYFYTSDEPVAGLEWMPWTGWDIDRTKYVADYLNSVWPDAQIIVPHHDDTPYPDHHYTRPLSSYADYEKKDATQEMIESECVTFHCPMVYAFVPLNDARVYGARIMSNFISGMYYPNGGNSAFYQGYFNWEDVYGDFYDRVMSQIKLKNDAGEKKYEMWEYGCGDNSGYTYCNHLIENTGLQTKLMFWQAFQSDVKGYLYYGTNNWNEYGSGPDSTTTGAKTTCKWYTNSNGSVYGNGMLFYGATMGRIMGVDVIGSLRVEILRDSVEEYEMLTMLSELEGNKKAKNIVRKVSANPARYLSLANFTTPGFSADMDEYDIMAAVRKELGDEIEMSVHDGVCAHEWDSGVNTIRATCTKMGEMKYTCTKCAAVKTEKIPTLHAVGDCFTKVGGIGATCTVDGPIVYQCSVCSYKKTVTERAYHQDIRHFVYEMKDDANHIVKCDVCGKALSTDVHVEVTVKNAPTCTEGGSTETKCIYCEKSQKTDETEPSGHTFEKGYCTVCGEKDPTYEEFRKGDINHDGKINASDIAVMKKIIVGKSSTVKEADINGDGKYSASDTVILKKMIVGKAWE